MCRYIVRTVNRRARIYLRRHQHLKHGVLPKKCPVATMDGRAGIAICPKCLGPDYDRPTLIRKCNGHTWRRGKTIYRVFAICVASLLQEKNMKAPALQTCVPPVGRMAGYSTCRDTLPPCTEQLDPPIECSQYSDESNIFTSGPNI